MVKKAIRRADPRSGALTSKSWVFSARFASCRTPRIFKSKNAAERNGLSENEVETILKEKFADLKTDKPTGLKKLGIDEIASG